MINQFKKKKQKKNNQLKKQVCNFFLVYINNIYQYTTFLTYRYKVENNKYRKFIQVLVYNAVISNSVQMTHQYISQLLRQRQIHFVNYENNIKKYIPIIQQCSQDNHSTLNKIILHGNTTLLKTNDFKCLFLSLAVNFRFITVLEIVNVQINDESLEVLQKLGWIFIKKINLSKNHIGPQGAKILSKMDIKYVTYVKLNYCPIGNKGLSYLSKSKWPNLQHLQLQDAQLTDDGLRMFNKAKWQKLQRLDIYGNHFSIQLMKQLHGFKIDKIQFVWIGKKSNTDNCFLDINGFSKLVPSSTFLQIYSNLFQRPWRKSSIKILKKYYELMQSQVSSTVNQSFQQF